MSDDIFSTQVQGVGLVILYTLVIVKIGLQESVERT